MNKVFRAILSGCIFFVIVTGYSGSVHAQNENVIYSLLFSWKTEGSPELLAKKATAVKKLKTPQGIVLSFGSLLGSTRIVQNDNGVQYLRAAYDGGLDCIIPAKGEFMFGVDEFRKLVKLSGMPRFISANIVDEKTRRTIVSPYFIWSVSGLRICIIGMSDIDIIKDSPDKDVLGLDVISVDEALSEISEDVAREYPDMVIVMGRLDRNSIMELTKKHRFIDVFVTNNQSGGFSGITGTSTHVLVSDRPVYIASEQSDHLSRLTTAHSDGIETHEFTDILLGDDFPPDTEITAGLSKILEELKQKDNEEAQTVNTGKEVATILKEVFTVDVVLLERGSLFFYPLDDSLTLFDIRKVVKPAQRLTSLQLKGLYLKSIREQSKGQSEPAMRLQSAGITDDGKVDTIPIQDDREYTVLTTTFLRSGGNGYSQFIQGTNDRLIDEGMRQIVESYLVAKDERLRKAAKKKIWELSLNMAMGSNFNRSDIDRDQALYGSTPPKEFKDLKELFTGHFEVSSWDDKLLITQKRHIFEARLRARYLRSGYRTETGDIAYKEGRDELQLYNKYTYDLSGFKIKPFVGIDVFSEFYSPAGKHPIVASTRAGLSREVKHLWNIVVEVGLDGTRNYVKNENSFGTTNTIALSRSLPAKGLFTAPTKVTFDARMTWNPMARYHMAFYLQNNNRIEIQIWKKFNATFHVKSYSYRDTRYRRVAVGLIYDFTLNYKMDWKF